MTDQLSDIAAHALHNLFVVTKRTGLEWPKHKSVDFLEAGTLINVEEISLRPSESPFDAFDIWVGVQWRAMPEHPHYTEYHFPLEFLTDRCDIVEIDVSVLA